MSLLGFLIEHRWGVTHRNVGDLQTATSLQSPTLPWMMTSWKLYHEAPWKCLFLIYLAYLFIVWHVCFCMCLSTSAHVCACIWRTGVDHFRAYLLRQGVSLYQKLVYSSWVCLPVWPRDSCPCILSARIRGSRMSLSFHVVSGDRTLIFILVPTEPSLQTL